MSPGWWTARAARTPVPGQLPDQVEQRVLQLRAAERLGPVRIDEHLGLNASTVARVLVRHRVPLLRDVDPTSGLLLRGSRSFHERHEYDQPGGLIHVDVKELGDPGRRRLARPRAQRGRPRTMQRLRAKRGR